MRKIGGNTTATIQVKETVLNEIHERISVWSDVLTLKGWLDLANGDSARLTYSAKIQESTHYFLCDYQDLDGITPEDARMVINSKVYEITLIDNPMELNEHLEIYLKYVGGNDGTGGN